MLSCHLFDGSVCSASVIHDVDNTSDHNPVSVILDITVPRLTFSRLQRTVRPAWCKATDDHIAAYKATVQANLSNIKLTVDSLHLLMISHRHVWRLVRSVCPEQGMLVLQDGMIL